MLNTVQALLWTFLGIILSLVLPLAVKTLSATRKGLELKDDQRPPTYFQKLARRWAEMNGTRYIKILAATLVIAAVLGFLIGDTLKSAKDAITFGFAWEGLISKFSSNSGSS